MKIGQAGLLGALAGFLLGSAICLIQGIPPLPAVIRIAILTAAAGWIGLMLAWLNQLLPSYHANDDEQQESGR